MYYNYTPVPIFCQGQTVPKRTQYAGNPEKKRIKPPDNKYPLLSYAIAGGLYHPNCKDIHTTYFEGISSPPKPLTDEEKRRAEENYKLEQQQRYNERQIRKYKRLSEYTLDPQERQKYAARLEQWQQANAKLVEEHGDVLRRRYEREVARDLRVKVPAPPSVAKTAQKSIDKSAGSGIIKARKLAQKKKFNYRDFDEVIDAKSVDDLKVFAADKMGISHISGIQKLKNGKQAQELLSKVEELSEKHGKRFTRISLLDYGDNKTAAETVESELRLNVQYLNRPRALQAVLDEWEDSGYIPKGCNANDYVAKHEYYHLLTQDMIDESHSKIETLVKRAVNDGCEIISENGRYDCHEFVADLLSAKTLTKSQKKLKDSIMKILGTRR